MPNDCTGDCSMILEPTRFDAIAALKPGSEWYSTADGVLHWISKDTTAPTEEEIAAKLTELKAAAKHKLQRQEEYPSWEDQLDKIYHSGIDAWKADIKTIKDKYPKP